MGCDQSRDEKLSKQNETLLGLQKTCVELEMQLAALTKESPEIRKRKMASLEAEVHNLEKRLDGSNAANLCKTSAVVITEEEARIQKKDLLKRSEALLDRIDHLFKEMDRGETLSDLQLTCAGIEAQLEALIEESPDDRTKIALLEAEVHKFEKRLDGCNAGELCKNSAVVITEEEARLQKKDLLKRTEVLLDRIEQVFKDMKL